MTETRLNDQDVQNLLAALFPGSEWGAARAFIARTARWAEQEADPPEAFVAAFFDTGPQPYVRLWLGPVNLLRAPYDGGVYLVLDRRALDGGLLAQLEEQGRVLEREEYKHHAPNSIGAVIDPSVLGGPEAVQIEAAARRHATVASRAGRGQFRKHHQSALARAFRHEAHTSGQDG